jgi:hypothetical protein
VFIKDDEEAIRVGKERLIAEREEKKKQMDAWEKETNS